MFWRARAIISSVMSIPITRPEGPTFSAARITSGPPPPEIDNDLSGRSSAAPPASAAERGFAADSELGERLLVAKARDSTRLPRQPRRSTTACNTSPAPFTARV